MDQDQLLSQLRDAHAPDAIGHWPVAPGWWILLILALTCIICLVYFCHRKWSSTIWKRQALKELSVIQTRYLTEPTSSNLTLLNQLLKRSICSARNTHNYLQVTGSQWAELLASVPNVKDPVLRQQDIEILSQGIYEAQTEKLDKAAFHRIEKWIRQSGNR